MHSVSRLSDTWKHLDYKTRQQWQRINSFCSFEGNYKSYRSHMRKIFSSSKTPNVLPYVGMYLRDLTALEEGTGSFDKGGAGNGVRNFIKITVNFHKMRMVANVIAEIQQAQRSVFNFQRHLDIISALSCGLFAFDEERLHELSKRCEPSPEPLPENFFDNQ